MNRFEQLYKQKLTTPDEAVKLIDSGSQLVVPLANGQPPALLDALGERVLRGEVAELTCVSGVDIKLTKLYTPEVAAMGTVIDTNYVGPAVRYWVQKGVFTCSPGNMSDSAHIGMRCRPRMETMMCVVSPMDRHGFFSTGTDPDWTWEIGKRGKDIKNIIVEVNSNMPRTYGNNQYHITEVAAVVENHLPLVELPHIPITKEDELIGQYIAEQVPDEACLQLGIGAIPNAVAKFLNNKRDLGVHSEMLCDNLVELYEQGVITCAKKTYMPDKWISAFALGTRKLYDFIDENPLVEMHGVTFVNDPYLLALNENLISINATLEVDLTGQCASEAIAYTQYTGTGGQVDFVRAAWRSKGGKSFLACYSTYSDKNGEKHSKIVPHLALGSIVTTPRTETMYVVTEYGIAYLKGQNIKTRTQNMIAIAHPDFRDWLRYEAKRMCLI